MIFDSDDEEYAELVRRKRGGGRNTSSTNQTPLEDEKVENSPSMSVSAQPNQDDGASPCSTLWGSPAPYHMSMSCCIQLCQDLKDQFFGEAAGTCDALYGPVSEAVTREIFARLLSDDSLAPRMYGTAKIYQPNRTAIMHGCANSVGIRCRPGP